MHDYQRILALVDFSRDGEKVAWRALRLARMTGAEVAWLHLIDADGQLDGGYPRPSRTSQAQGYEDAARLRLRHLAAALHGDEAILAARYGEAATAYLEYTETWRPDLVIAAADPGYLAGPHDLLLLGKAPRGMLRRLRVWLAELGNFLHGALPAAVEGG